MIQRIFLTILGIMVGLLALLFVAVVLIRGAIQRLFVRFGTKKTVVVATMALVLLSVATAHAGNTVARIEDGNLVYYEKTGTVVRDVPKGLTAEQARQLVDGEIPDVSFSSEKVGSYFGLPLTEIKTETTVSFRSGWIVEGKSHESFSVWSLFYTALIVIFILFPSFVFVCFGDFPAIFSVMVTFLVLVGVKISTGDELLSVVAVAILLLIGFLPGWYFRRRREKREARSGYVLAMK